MYRLKVIWEKNDGCWVAIDYFLAINLGAEIDHN
jgi:hypothetical protein